MNLIEGLPSYGPVLPELYLPVDGFPVAEAEGNIRYERKFNLGGVQFEVEGKVIRVKQQIKIPGIYLKIRVQKIDIQHPKAPACTAAAPDPEG